MLFCIQSAISVPSFLADMHKLYRQYSRLWHRHVGVSHVSGVTRCVSVYNVAGEGTRSYATRRNGTRKNDIFKDIKKLDEKNIKDELG